MPLAPVRTVPPATHTCLRFGDSGSFNVTVEDWGAPTTGRETKLQPPLWGRDGAVHPFPGS